MLGLIKLIKPYIKPLPRWGEEKISRKAELNDIPAETRLAITLRWLAGGSYLDICFGFGIAYGTVHSLKKMECCG